jgi:CDP-glucose 4,6-dehydratase
VNLGFWRGRRVLLTGHTGFKGAWLGLWLAELGAEVTGLALPPETTPNLFTAACVDRRLDSHIGDVRDLTAVVDVMSRTRPHVVLHLAGQALVRRSYADPVGTYATNVMGTVHVLEAARRVDGLVAVIVVTSDKCYENVGRSAPYDEREPLGGHDPYSSSKAGAEVATSAWRRSFLSTMNPPVGVATARAGNVIGGGDWADDRLVPDCMRSFAARAPAMIRNPGARRAWQHVLDPLAGYLTLAERLAVEPTGVDEGWNFGPTAEVARPVSWVADRLAAGWGEEARWERDTISHHPHEAMLLHVDASKARARLGWEPRLPLDEALDWTVEWYRRFDSGADAASLTLEQISRFEALAAQECA